MLLHLLVTLLNRSGGPRSEKEPWEKDNSWLINTKIKPEISVKQVVYKDMDTSENISAGITDISIVVMDLIPKVEEIRNE